MTSSNAPVKIQIAFNVMAYCQSVQSTTFDRSPVGMARSEGRSLSEHERGMLIAAQNLTRDFLNGEIELDDQSSSDRPMGQFGVGEKTFQLIAPVSDACDDSGDEDAHMDEGDSSSEDFPF